MKVNDYSQVELTELEAFAALYTGKIVSLKDVYVDFVENYNRARAQNADDIPELKTLPEIKDSMELFDQANQHDWFMPKDAVKENLIEMLYGMCTTDQQRARVDQELTLFIQHDMLEVLFYCKYLVDTMRANNIVWGVGRGSSVASYVLYLVGIHRIDSMKYGLDINEFLK